MKKLSSFSFYNYFRALMRAPFEQPNGSFAIYFITGFAIYILNTVFLFSGNGLSFFLSFFALLLFGAGISVNMCHERQPNLISIMPLSGYKKLLYRFLSIIVLYLLILFFIVVISILVVFITLLFMGFPSCNEIPTTPVEDEEVQVFSFGTYGILFFVAYMIIMYSSVNVAGFIKRNRNRIIYLICFGVGIVLFVAIMNIPYILANGVGINRFSELFPTSPFSEDCYSAMKLPWLCISIWLVGAVAFLGVAIFMGIKNEKERTSF